MLAFAAAVFLLIITPGPGVLSLAGVGSAFGFRSAFRYFFGLFLGNNLVALAVVTGIAALILANPVIRTVLLMLSTAYLLYLAFRIATSGNKVAIMPAVREPGILDGVVLQIFNPKAYVVNTTLFSGFPFFLSSYGFEVAVKFLLANMVWIPLHFMWLGLGVKIKQIALPENVQKTINLALALALVGVVGLAVFATL